MIRRTQAWLNLAYRFAVHSVKLPLRTRRRRRDSARFLDAVVPDGYVPLSAEERADYPSFMACVGCGLCTLACPTLRETPGSAWEEAWTFVVGPARSIDRPTLLEPPPCTRCGECEAVCPMGVPVARLAALAERLGAGFAEFTTDARDATAPGKPTPRPPTTPVTEAARARADERSDAGGTGAGA